MTIAWLRDLVIVVLGIMAIGALVFWAWLSYRFYRRLNTVMAYIEATAKEIRDIADFFNSQIAGPMAWMAAIMQGIQQGFGIFNQGSAKNKKEEEKEHG